VWIDALTNYLTVMGVKEPGDLRKVGEVVGPMQHIIGKDIAKFHCMYWPRLLISLQKDAIAPQLPSSVIVHSHWLMDN